MFDAIDKEGNVYVDDPRERAGKQAMYIKLVMQQSYVLTFLPTGAVRVSTEGALTITFHPRKKREPRELAGMGRQL
jgi:hypothetical protein